MKKILKLIVILSLYLFVNCGKNYGTVGQVETKDATEIGSNTVTLNGKCKIFQKNLTISNRGFIYGTSPTQLNSTVYTEEVGTGNFSCFADYLYPNTRYYYKAFIVLPEISYRDSYYSKTDIYTGNSETFYGNLKDFTTTDGETPNLEYVVLNNYGIAVQKTDLGWADWNSAKIICEQSHLGNFSDWRLPTQAELLILYNNRNTIGNFRNGEYWSSTNSSGSSSHPDCVDFQDGNSSSGYENDQRYVRAVRTLP
jgi:hypothetical protein